MSRLQRYSIWKDGHLSGLIADADDNGPWVKASDAEGLEKRNAELEKALKTCHGRHQFPTQCAELVDVYYHELFSDAYNPHKHWSERK
jgi:hypothetical protein